MINKPLDKNSPIVDESKMYDTWIKPVEKKFARILLTEEDVKKIDDLTNRMVAAKLAEEGRLQDNNGLYKRYNTGLTGERAIEKHLNMDFLDDAIGHSSTFAIADLKKAGYNIGVKCVVYGENFPLIQTHCIRPEIILFRHPKNKCLFMFCGLYTADILNTYQHRQLVKDPAVSSAKNGFYGIPFFNRINVKEDLDKFNK